MSEERAVRVVGRGESQSSFKSLIFILNAGRFCTEEGTNSVFITEHVRNGTTFDPIHHIPCQDPGGGGGG